MRWVHLAVIVLFAAVTTIFAVQNLQIVTVSLLRTGKSHSPSWLRSSICWVL